MNSKLNVVNQGFLLKKIRKELDLSGNDFAEPLGFTGAYQYNLEKAAKIPKKIVKKVVEIFQINGNYLETGEGEMFQKKEGEGEPQIIIEGDLKEDYKQILLEAKKQTKLLEQQNELFKQFLEHQNRDKYEKSH
jgi:hypothetical protein